MQYWGLALAGVMSATAVQARWANNPSDSSLDVLRPDNQDKERQQVNLLLMHVDDRMTKVGYSLAMGPAIASLASSERHELRADLIANQTYVVRAVCDMQCGDNRSGEIGDADAWLDAMTDRLLSRATGQYDNYSAIAVLFHRD